MTLRTQIRGIVVAGNSLAEAQALYRAVATGDSAVALHDEQDTFVVLASSQSDIQMLNPLTGADDLVEGDGLVEQMEFVSSAGEELDTNYTVCASGCGAHILADDIELLRHCPACASVVEDLDAEAIAAATKEEEAEGAAIASGATLEEAIASFRALVLGEVAPQLVDSQDVILAVAGNAAYDVYTGAEAKHTEIESAYLESVASSSDEVQAHHFVCASSECASPHIVSSDDMPVFCPSCSSGLLDPSDEEATASDEDEEDFDEDDLEDEEDDSFDEDLEDEEDDAAFLESLSGDDDDEDEDGEDDDEDDEDEDDEDDEDEDEDEDEDDDKKSKSDDDSKSKDKSKDKSKIKMSLSSTNRKRMRRRVPAVASAADYDTEQVRVSYMAIAGAEEDAIDKLHVSYASNVMGENLWYASLDRIPVAMALASETKHTDIFNSEVFGRAVLAQAREHGLVAALANMGFQEIKPEIQVGDHVSNEVRTQVAEQVSEVKDSAEQDRQELHERFTAALAIAASGITRGFFKDRSNPIITSLAAALGDAGIQNAGSLVQQAFSAHSDAYHKELLAQARVIMDYDLNVQNQLATAIGESTNAVAAAAPISLGRPVGVEKEAPIESTASNQNLDFAARLNNALSSLGNRR